MIALIFIDPVEMIPTMIFCVIWIAVWLWIVNLVFGKKDDGADKSKRVKSPP